MFIFAVFQLAVVMFIALMVLIIGYLVWAAMPSRAARVPSGAPRESLYDRTMTRFPRYAGLPGMVYGHCCHFIDEPARMTLAAMADTIGEIPFDDYVSVGIEVDGVRLVETRRGAEGVTTGGRLGGAPGAMAGDLTSVALDEEIRGGLQVWRPSSIVIFAETVDPSIPVLGCDLVTDYRGISRSRTDLAVWEIQSLIDSAVDEYNEMAPIFRSCEIEAEDLEAV